VNDRAPPPPSRDDDPARPLPEAGDAVEQRFVDVLRGSSSGASLRRQLEGEDGDDASDLLGRLNALEFVDAVVGGAELPERIGGYEIKGLLGRGGMGTVFLGWQPELEREVALKVLSSTFTSDPTMRKRFRAEARATAALHHRHIVPIYDYGEAQGTLFFAMERVDGMSLDKHIQAAARRGEKPLDPLDAARRFAGVADALGLAHRRRLLHRDVKPGNLLMASDGTLALTDFGLAKALDQVSVRLTSKGGGFLGTLYYAPPEQALGRELTPASDLYALGVTLFEAVTGELPVTGRTTEALLQSILHGTPRRLRECLPKPPRDLEAVLDKLLQREPEDRYQDGEELARDLVRIAEGEPVHIRRLPLPVRLWRRARKNPVLTSAVMAIGVLLLATFVLLTVLRREKGQSLVSRHQNNLVAIARDIGRELGSPWGPPPLLQCLTGVEVPAASPSEVILAAFRRAEQEMPGDRTVGSMRLAYERDPSPAASALLREGRGHEAMQVYDVAIAEAVAARTGGDLAEDVRLYGLYVARGVAKLTATVARPNDARTDLSLASYLRPGAAFPSSLLDVLELVQHGDVAARGERLARGWQQASPERVRTIALLLWTAAGLQRPAAANLMDFALGFQQRAELHRLAASLLAADAPDGVRVGEPTGLSAQFAAACREALDRVADPIALLDLAERTGKAIDGSVHADAPLAGWRSVLQLLLQPRQRGPLVDRDQAPLPPELQLAAWEDLLRLQPRRELVQLWLPRFEELRQSHPNLRGIVAVAARLHAIAATPAALPWADAWVVEADGDPDAYLCRMLVRLRLGLFEEARDDAIVAVQHSVAPDVTARDVVREAQVLAPELEPGVAEAVRVLAQQFRTLVDSGSLARGAR
jgi:serine/threonine protein kinase